MRRMTLTCSILATVLLGPTAACAPIPESRQRLTRHTITVDGRERHYYLHLPAGRESDEPLPLVLALHGGGRRGDARRAADAYGFKALADRERFIVAYPNGIGNAWNDGRGFNYDGPIETDVDDVGFLSALIDHLIREHNADAHRVYMTGLSNGGMMTLRFACELTSKLAAIAPVIASIPTNILGTCRPSTHLPVLVMNGTADPLVPWDGGYVRFRRTTMGRVVSTDQTVQFWVGHNGCKSEPTIVPLPDKDTNDNSTVDVVTYANSKNGSEVILYAIQGGGHTLPGSIIPDRPRLLGHKNMDIQASEVIWTFFKRHAR